MAKPATPLVWASGKTFSFQPNSQQQAEGYDYLQALRQGVPITDDHDFPFNQITTGLKWVMDQLPDGGIQSLLTALLPKRSFSQSDFIRIPDSPGGLLIQWGTTTSLANGQSTVTFPVPFTQPLVSSVSERVSSSWGSNTVVVYGTSSMTSTTMSVSARTITGTAGPVAAVGLVSNWIVVGY